MRKIEHGTEIVFKNEIYTTSVTFELYSAKKTNHINIFESHKKVFATMKMIDNTIKIITKKEKFPTVQTSYQKDKHIWNNSYPSMKYNDREKKLYAIKWNYPS